MRVRQTKIADRPSSKTHGRVYTPSFIVNLMLDRMGYVGWPDIHGRHIIDNSCGDGAFLTEIVRRYCEAFSGNSALPDAPSLKHELETYVHGIEIDRAECHKCIENVSAVAAQYGVMGLDWDIICADTLDTSRYDCRMDYVVGNPPYVRVHNLSDSYDAVKKYRFAAGGMTDLFIVFFEIGFNMLSAGGKMCLITPSSWLGSKAGAVLRSHISSTCGLYELIDLGHFQAFSDVTTYTLISLFDNTRHASISYSTYSQEGLTEQDPALPYSDFMIGGQFYLSDREVLSVLRDIRSGDTSHPEIRVKNGFATLADGVFIGSFGFSSHTIRVLKASTGQWYECIFPYDDSGQVVSEEELKKDRPLYSYLLKNKERLTRGRDVDSFSAWYAFGRTQAILDVPKRKYSMNSLVRDIGSIKLTEVAPGEGVYSGLYILTDLTFNELEGYIKTADFIRYVKALKNYKSGGYYTFSSKDLELYLNYKIMTR